MFENEDQIKDAILNGDLEDFISHGILESVPHAFNRDLKAWIVWKTELAGLLEVDPKDVILTGSAAVGFSLNPKKDFSPFTKESDFDCGIISPYHFDQAWRYLRDQRVDWLTISGEQKRAIRQHRESYVFDGTIATDKILHLLPFGRDWQSALDLMSATEMAAGRDVKLRIYRDFQSLRHYHSRGLTYLRDKVLSPADTIETIPTQSGECDTEAA